MCGEAVLDECRERSECLAWAEDSRHVYGSLVPRRLGTMLCMLNCM